MYGYIDRWIDEQIGRQKERQINGWMVGWI